MFLAIIKIAACLKQLKFYQSVLKCLLHLNADNSEFLILKVKKTGQEKKHQKASRGG